MYYITLNIIVKLIIELFIELFIELTFDFIKLVLSLISAPYCSQNRVVCPFYYFIFSYWSHLILLYITFI